MRTNRYLCLDTDQIKKMHSLQEWTKVADNAMRENTGISDYYKIIPLIITNKFLF